MKAVSLLYLEVLLIVSMSCVQKKHQKIIEIKIDLPREQPTHSVGIRGSMVPLSWDRTTLMENHDGDGIYRLKLMTAKNNLEFKIVTSDTIFELNGQNNRRIEFDYCPEAIFYSSTYNDTVATIIKR